MTEPALSHSYECPPGIKPETHARFLAVVARATLAAALPAEMLAETPEEEDDLEVGAPPVVDPEDLGAGQTRGYRAGEESA